MKILRSLDDQAAYLDAKKRELGLTFEDFAKCRNSGRRRTESKKSLLQLLSERLTSKGKIRPWWA
jgi:hypothetical protein